MNVPNRLTILRVAMIPLFVIAMAAIAVFGLYCRRSIYCGLYYRFF